MKDTEIMNRQPSDLPADTSQALAQMAQAIRGMNEQMAQAMRGMADMLRMTNERMAALEQQVRLLTKVTPAQAGEINAAIRGRAAELCATYRAPGCEKAVANAIRREMRLTQGVQSVRELARCEYPVALQQARIWDDHKAMKAIKAKGR